MNDHAKTIRQQQQEVENAAMEELEQRGAPFLWLCIGVMLVAAGLGLYSGWKKHVEAVDEYNELSARYVELQQQNEAFIACLNGKTVRLGNEVLRCRIKPREVEL